MRVDRAFSVHHYGAWKGGNQIDKNISEMDGERERLRWGLSVRKGRKRQRGTERISLFSNYVSFHCRRGGYEANSTCPPSLPLFSLKAHILFFFPCPLSHEAAHGTETNRWEHQSKQKRHFVVPVTVTTTLYHLHNEGLLCFCAVKGEAPFPFARLGLPLPSTFI